MKKEYEILQDLISELDYLLNEGVVITLQEKANFILMFEKGLDIMADFNHINENGNVQILGTEFTNNQTLNVKL